MESMPGRIQAAVPFIKIGNVFFVLGPGTATAVTASANGFWQFWNDKLPFSWIQIILLCFSFFQLGTAMSWSALMSSQPLPTISNQYHGPISSAWNLQSFGVSSMKQLDFKDLEDLTASLRHRCRTERRRKAAIYDNPRCVALVQAFSRGILTFPWDLMTEWRLQ